MSDVTPPPQEPGRARREEDVGGGWSGCEWAGFHSRGGKYVPCNTMATNITPHTAGWQANTGQKKVPTWCCRGRSLMMVIVTTSDDTVSTTVHVQVQ